MAISDYPGNSRGNGRLARKGGPWIITILILIALVAVILLPPVSAVQRVMDLGMTRIPESGGVINDPDGTQVTFQPGTVSKSFRAKLASVPRVAFLEGSAGGELLAAAKAIPTNLVAKSPFYQLEVRGTAPNQSSWLMPIPNDSEPYETLDVYTWDNAAGRWQWVPHNVIADADQIESTMNWVPSSLMIVQTNPLETVAGADVALAGSLAGDSQGALAQIHPTGTYLSGDGGLDGTVDAGFETLNTAYAVVPVIRNYNGPIVRSDLLANMVSDQAQRDAHIDALVNLAVGGSYAGIDIDYHGLDPALKSEFNQFIAKLAEKLHEQNKTLGVRVERPTQVAEDRWDTGPYDWQTLGLLVDTLMIPAPLDPQAYVPGGQFEALLGYAVGLVDRYKLEMLLSGQSVEQAGSYYLLKNYSDALQPLIGRIQADQTIVQPGQPLNLALVSSHANSGLVYDPNLGTYVYRYADDQGNARTVWLENAASLSHKVQMLGKYNVRGFTVENLPGSGQDPDLWTLMRNYQQGRAQPINSNFTVNWTIKDSQGKVTTQSRPLSDAKLAMMAPPQPGQLEIKLDVLDRGQVVSEATVSGISVATYTPSPTPTPEFTPTPVASATPSYAQMTAKGDTVNVRSGPGTEYPKIGSLDAGKTVKITGKNDAGDWYQFQLGEENGWVFGQMVTTIGGLDQVAQVKVAAAPTAAAVQAAAPAAKTGGSVAAAPAAPPARGGGSGFDYGIQIADYNLAESAGMIKNMGFNWVKKQVPWKDCEGSPGAIDFGCVDGFVNTMAGAGIKVMASVPKAPAWARPGGTDMSVEGPPADPNTYANFVGKLAGHYCGKINAIEVWNEQNLWYEWGHQNLNAADYVALLRVAYNAIKAACPSTMVISGALTPTGAPAPWAVDDFTYLEQMYQAGLASVSDGIGAHPSGFNVSPDVSGGSAACDYIAGRNAQYRGPCNSPHHSWSFRNTLEGYRNIMVKYGDTNKRIWPTEFGWASGWTGQPGYEYANDNSKQDQANYTVRAYQLMKSWGWVGPAFLWNLNFNVTNPGTELSQWGIVGQPAYSALASMAK
jgi:uncharacterized protein YraI